VTQQGGRSDVITPRDEAIMGDLLSCEALTIEQIWELHFKTRTRAKQRLYDLRKRAYLDNRVVPLEDGTTLNFFSLAKKGHEHVARYLDMERPYAGPPSIASSRAEHLRDTNELYVKIREELDAQLGAPGGRARSWEWFSEKRAHLSMLYGNERRVHQPDARIAFYGTHLVIERQSRRARATVAEIYRKVEAHRLAMSRPEAPDPSGTELLFACDEERDVQTATRAAKQYGVVVVAGSPEAIVTHIVGRAMEVAAHLAEQDRRLVEAGPEALPNPAS
jgi:Replication-relaxation